MADIHRTRTIAARADEIWDVLADFGSISSWADNVDHSCILFSGPTADPSAPPGESRSNATPSSSASPSSTRRTRSAYDIEGLPSRLRRVTNRWTLAAGAGDSTVVTLTSTVEIGPRPPQKLAERVLCRFLARQSDAMLAGLANRLENARV